MERENIRVGDVFRMLRDYGMEGRTSYEEVIQLVGGINVSKAMRLDFEQFSRFVG